MKPERESYTNSWIVLILAFILGIAIWSLLFASAAASHVTDCTMFGVPENGGCLEPGEEGPLGLTNNDPEHVLCYVEGIRPGTGSAAGEPYVEIVPCPLPPQDGDEEFEFGGEPDVLTSLVEREPQPGPDPASAPAELAAIEDEIAWRTAGLILTALIAGGAATAAVMMRRDLSKDM